MNLGEENPKQKGLMRIEKGCSLGEFAEQAQSYVQDLITLHPAFRDLGVMNDTPGPFPPINESATNVAELVTEWGWDHQMPDAFTDLDELRRPTATSRPTGTMGFHLDLSNRHSSWDDRLTVSVRRNNAGPRPHRPLRGVFNLCLPRAAHPEFRTDILLARRLMELAVRHWPVQTLQYGLDGMDLTVNARGDLSSSRKNQELNWLSYSDDPSLANALPPEVRVEPLGPGILMQLSPTILSHHNPEHVDLAERVRDSLEAAGKLALKQPTI
jgi:hypothetical protein